MLAKLRVSRLLHRYTPGEGLGTAKSFVDVAYNYVTVNNKGGATCNNTTLRFFIYHKIDSNIASEALDQAVSLLPLSRHGMLLGSRPYETKCEKDSKVHIERVGWK